MNLLVCKSTNIGASHLVERDGSGWRNSPKQGALALCGWEAHKGWFTVGGEVECIRCKENLPPDAVVDADVDFLGVRGAKIIEPRG